MANTKDWGQIRGRIKKILTRHAVRYLQIYTGPQCLPSASPEMLVKRDLHSAGRWRRVCIDLIMAVK